MSKTKLSEIDKIVNVIKQKLQNYENLKKKYPKRDIYVESIKNNKDFSFLLSILTAQQKGPRYQERFTKLFNGTTVPSSENKGDFKTISENNLEIYYEVKSSNPSADGNVLNMVQIRLFQNIQFYLCVFIDDIKYIDNYAFLLTKEQMIDECSKIANNAHIAKTAIKSNTTTEKRISLNLNDLNNINTKRWIANYRNIEIEKLLFNNEG